MTLVRPLPLVAGSALGFVIGVLLIAMLGLGVGIGVQPQAPAAVDAGADDGGEG